MKKKLLVLTLALCTAFSLTACSNKVEDSVRGTVSNATSEAASTEAAAEDSAEAEGSEEVATETGEATEATEAAEDEGLTLGHSESNSYESTFLGLGCKFDSNWTFMTDEQIRANSDLTAELIDDQAYTDALKEGSVITDMMVQNATTASSVSITIEKLQVTMKGVVEEDYVDAVMPQMGSTLESAGFSNVQIEKVTVNFLGEDRVALKINSTVNGIAVNQLQIPIKKGSYIACITASAFGDNTVDEMIDAFYTLN